jgi:hypothetical protein
MQPILCRKLKELSSVYKVEVTIKDNKRFGALLGHRGIGTLNLAGVVTFYDQRLNPYS